MARFHTLLGLLPLLTSPLLVGCGDDDSIGAPEGVACNAVIDGGQSGASLTAALSQAQSGDCVVAQGVQYQGSFTVPKGVKLVAAEGATPEIHGQGDATTLTLGDDPGSLLRGLVVDGGGIGVFVPGTQGAVQDVMIMNASKAGLAAYRDIALGGPDTLPADGIQISGADIHQNAIGVWASNVRIALEAGEIKANTSDGLTGGFGLVAVAGAQVAASGTVVEANDYGVVLDGVNGTAAHLTSLQVLANTERGIWAQKLAGTIATPALTIDGADTLVDSNNHTGIGALESKGIIIIGGKVSNTQKKPVALDIGTTVDIGDGVGLFQNTGDVKLDGVTLENNQRAQGLVDLAAAGIIIIGGKVTAGAGQHKLVIQNSTETVDAPAADVTPNVTLDVSAPELMVADVTQ